MNNAIINPMASRETAPRLTRTEAKAETRRRVLEAAEAAFRRDGYHGASLERIAAEAGFTTGAIYSTFDSKAEIMLALIASQAARRREAVTDTFAKASDPERALAELARRYGAEAAPERSWSTALVEFMVAVGRDDRLRARYAEHHEASREALVTLIVQLRDRTGASLAIPPRRLATAVMSLHIGLTVESLLAPAEVPQDLYVDAQLALRRGALADPERR